jgi:glutamine amidotransferase-like uncharacterized protein
MNRKTALQVMTALTSLTVAALSSMSFGARAAAPGDLDLMFSGTGFGYTLNGFTYYDYGAQGAYHAGIAIDQAGLILTAERGGKTVSDTEAYRAAVRARMIH